MKFQVGKGISYWNKKELLTIIRGDIIPPD